MHPPTSRRIEKISTVGNIISVRLVVHKCTSKNENYGTSLHLSLFKEAKIFREFLFILKGRGTPTGTDPGGRSGPCSFFAYQKNGGL